jgi:hypothetical protein
MWEARRNFGFVWRTGWWASPNRDESFSANHVRRMLGSQARGDILRNEVRHGATLYRTGPKEGGTVMG